MHDNIHLPSSVSLAETPQMGAERTVLVTGGTDGIGRAVARQLARAGDRVLFVGRDVARGAEALAALRALAPREHAFLRADLSLLSETQRVVREVRLRTERIDALVLCAGILSTVPEWTEEGLERNFVLNYLTRFLMIRALWPSLERAPAGRVVLVSNAGQYPDTLDFDDLQHRRGRAGLKVAGRTQFANDLLCTELAERARQSAIDVSCVYPGMVKTAVFANARGLSWPLRLLLRFVQLAFASRPERAAATPAALARGERSAGARFYGPGLRAIAVPERALRLARRQALWSASELLVQPYLEQAAPT